MAKVIPAQFPPPSLVTLVEPVGQLSRTDLLWTFIGSSTAYQMFTGWTEVIGVYRVPQKATRAVVELYLIWAPGGRIEWSDVSVGESDSPAARKVRLATVLLAPKGVRSGTS